MCMQVIEVELDKGGKHEAGLLSRPELEQMITWETNNLYEYLKELYDHKQQDLADSRSVSLPTHAPQSAVTFCLCAHMCSCLYDGTCCLFLHTGCLSGSTLLKTAKGLSANVCDCIPFVSPWQHCASAMQRGAA